ncbi:uncharacterized protein [Eurosta solidaginis]|uniref:uncharacterized protein n=1 Tax=Eurosta solidaginis TaxID=178769 RepID=UPI003530FEF1
MIYSFIICAILFLSNLCDGYYLKPRNDLKDHGNEWSIFQKKLGLSGDKVELLKSQKNQQNTINLLHRFIEENPKYVRLNADNENKQRITDHLWNTFHTLFKNFRLPKQTLKTSLNFEFNDDDKSRGKNLNRSRRRIAVRMVDDIPTEKIDELLKMFNRENGIENTDLNEAENNDENDHAVAETPEKPSPAVDPDYVYESLYEDDQDAASPSKNYSNSEFRTLQDLILQANKSQW